MARIKFQIDYHANWGQQLCVCGSFPELGVFDENRAIELKNDGDLWNAELEIDTKSGDELLYYYFVREDSINVRKEWGEYRRLYLGGNQFFVLSDQWKNRPYHSYLYSSVFTESVFARETKNSTTKYPKQAVLLNVICPYVDKNQRLVVCGETEKLGSWNLADAPSLEYMGNGEWQIVFDAVDFESDAQYKFVIVDSNTNEAIHWEDGGNRILNGSLALQKTNFVYAETALEFRYLGYMYRGSGTAIPVFSLRSDDSFGIGDFIDLKKMVDWANLTNQQIIQVLPINDTTTTHSWRDSYPYSAISIYALHPIYLSCKSLPLAGKSKYDVYLKKAEKLNALNSVDYESVLKLKADYSRDLFEENGAETLASDAYKAFYYANKEWLFPYACYCFLRDKKRTARFTDWGEFAKYDKERIIRLYEENLDAKREIDFHSYVQFLLHNQLSEVKAYAHANGVALKGDIPIGIHRDSVDAWTNISLFNMDTQTGAPPDDFSFFGQNWRFPTYNWDAMARDNYSWWKNRFRKMADYFDAYRIDHILGFFRIWEIPIDAVHGLLGHFNPALPYWPDEIVRVGIPFDETRMARPFIHEGFLYEIFNEDTQEVINNYLIKADWGIFHLQSFCDTQQKIAHFFEDKTDEKNIRIRNGLLSLCCEVLFVKDRTEQHRYHPRITAQYTHSYQYLNDNEKNAFNRLYDDFFYRRHNYFWREQAMKKLPELISSTSMMVCGEDLGMVPECVPSVMSELQILSLEIQRMPKESHDRFSDLDNLPYLSVCTTSTHDMSPIRAWWRENREATQFYYNNILKHEGVAPDYCTPELCREILSKHLQSRAMWVIFPWQDWMSIDENLRLPNPEEERINIPSDPDHYWRYRMHISLDKLLENNALNDRIKRLNERMS